MFYLVSDMKKKKNFCLIFNTIVYLYFIFSQVGSVHAELQVTPAATQLAGSIDSTISLICSSSSKPILCLWKTPYGHVYTLSKGVFAESGRLRHKDDALDDECGLEIVGLEDQDSGQWECEVGSLIGDTFQTASANINLDVKSKKILGIYYHYYILISQ